MLSITPSQAQLGTPVDICLSTPPQDLAMLMASFGQGPVGTPLGDICLDLPLRILIPISMPASGQLCLPTFMHCEAASVGITLYMQFVSFATDGSDRAGRSNQASITGEDDGTGCDFCAVAHTKVRLLRMRYTGDDCGASHHSQASDKVNCSGDPAFAASVRIVVQDKATLGDNRAVIYFDGTVPLNGLFDIDAGNAGRDELKARTYTFLLDANDAVLQEIEFHTSCSQPLQGGDQFGSLLLVGFIPK